MYFKNFNFNNRCERKLKIKKNICSRFSDTVFHKIDIMGFGLNRDHPPAWELNYLDNRKKFL